MSADPDSTAGQIWAARAVHAFTASGILPGLLAVQATFSGDLQAALLWLGLAMLIDGLDGPLARRLEVTRHTPRFDGAVLDLVIDYFTYTIIPALMVFKAPFVPAGFEFAAAAFIMITSLYCFVNRDMKTADNFFQGFPATWNLVVLYFYVLQSAPAVNLAVIGLLGLLTFVPLKFVHPFRVTLWRSITLIATAAWALLSVWLVLTPPPAEQTAPWAFWLWIALSAYFTLLCGRRSFAKAAS